MINKGCKSSRSELGKIRRFAFFMVSAVILGCGTPGPDHPITVEKFKRYMARCVEKVDTESMRKLVLTEGPDKTGDAEKARKLLSMFVLTSFLGLSVATLQASDEEGDVHGAKCTANVSGMSPELRHNNK